MKQIFSVAFAIILLLCLAACGISTPQTETTAPTKGNENLVPDPNDVKQYERYNDNGEHVGYIRFTYGTNDGVYGIILTEFLDLDGNVHPFTAAQAADPDFANLILKSGNIYTFAQDGYGMYMSANLSITKEIGDHVSLSFFANNFTNSRPYVKSMATGVGAIFTPAFYYGLTCRLKF